MAIIFLNLSDKIRKNSNEIYYVFLENAGVRDRWTMLIKSAYHNPKEYLI